jgi:hypothetical protein
MSASKDQPLDDAAICPWCSAQVAAEASRCPSCGAALRDGADGDVLGVTQVDMAATSRLARLKPPGRIAQWLGAEPTTENAELAGKIEEPSDAVKAEMLRLELAAIDAEIEAKNAQLEAERMLAPEVAKQNADAAPDGSETAGDGSASATGEADAEEQPDSEPA